MNQQTEDQLNEDIRKLKYGVAELWNIVVQLMHRTDSYGTIEAPDLEDMVSKGFPKLEEG